LAVFAYVLAPCRLVRKQDAGLAGVVS